MLPMLPVDITEPFNKIKRFCENFQDDVFSQICKSLSLLPFSLFYRIEC